MEAIRARIASRALRAGDRLPSVRRLAEAMAISPSTVVEAYERLAAEGMVRARPGSGFFVASAAAMPVPLTELGLKLDRAVDPFWVSRQSLDAGKEVLKPGCGWMPADWMPDAAIRRAVRQLGKADNGTLTDYGTTLGLPALRQLLTRRFAAEGLDAAPDSIILTGSGSQSLDLVCRLLLRPGDAVLVDDPCYFNFQALLRAHGANVVGVPYRTDGPDVECFAERVGQHRPRLYLTNSALHNPTGASLKAQTAHRLLNIASVHDMVVVEDDIFADLEPEPSPRLAILDGLRQVIRVGSFSKTLSASIRCGYVAARPDWIEALVDLQVATSFGSCSPAAAAVVHAALSEGGYRRHLADLRRRLSRARHEVAEKLEGISIRPWLSPRGGFYLWCALPEERDAAELARAALRENVVLAPGNVFSISQSAQSFMRFNVAQMQDPRVFDVLSDALAAPIRER
ncbi:aminotransferase-like domain-containing protein [Aureimonas psammosilenae]|uniref:aminotransferase-like domain-containing protein n=1 Tax=Aureimonas psammosilenae TaxID=2495496 RepID=UPI0012610564|nr:PLP-dependent aminotransferase family protein [Aureimonas psammosilenae]